MARLTANERIDALDELRHDRAFTAAQAAAELHLAPGTVYSWISRGLLRPVGLVGKRKIYSLHDVATVEANTRHRTKPRTTSELMRLAALHRTLNQAA